MIPKLKFYHSKENEMYEVNGLRITQKTIECFPKNNRFSFITFEEDEGVLMQSTGLKDRNEIEMFEGDVVKTKYGEHGRHIGIVTFRYGKFLSIGVKQYEGYVEELDCMFEIIGNQFEHPHLIKE